ncbi:MAG: tetratricopeptide repeat protein [bacterium]|nr:tetratricopeptide repeat protein [bacterium]
MSQKRRPVFSLLIFILMVSFISFAYITLAWVAVAGAQASIPKEAKEHNQKGNEYCEKGEFAKGVAEYEKAVSLAPNFTDALYNAGLTYYMDLKDYAKAIFYFRRFLQVEPDSADAKQVKKWLAEAGQKLAAAKSSSPKAATQQEQKTQLAQAKSTSSPSIQGAEQKSVLATSPSTAAALPRPEASPTPGGADQTAQGPESKEGSAQATAQATLQPTLEETAQPAARAGETQPAQQAPISTPLEVSAQGAGQGQGPELKVEPQPTPSEQQAAASPELKAPEMKEQQQTAVARSPQEEARLYKEQGNEYNSQGKPEEAVAAYLKALEIYPQYTDALYNIAKTYDFSLKDYAKAIYYYQQFLQYETPNSRDAAQVKIWLRRAEEAYQAQSKQQNRLAAELQPEGGQTATSAQPKSAAPALAATKSSRVRALARGKKQRDFYFKEFLSSPSPSSSSAKENEKDTAETDSLKKAKAAEIQKAELQSAIISQSPETSQSPEIAAQPSDSAAAKIPSASPSAPVMQPSEQNLATPIPQVGVQVGGQSGPSPVNLAQSSAGREILIETVIPRDFQAPDLIPLVMDQMQKEITEILAQAGTESPEKLAQLYLSKVQSDILPSGERVSYLRLGSKELADLPYIRILTEEEKQEMEKEKWELIRTRKSPARLKEVLTVLRDGYRVIPHNTSKEESGK